MTKEEIYSLWAPDHSIWSPWVKPVLFAYMVGHPMTERFTKLETHVKWAPAPEARIAVILELPGDESVYTSLALAEKGYCPVPLFNAVPNPNASPIALRPGNPGVAVNVDSIIHALQIGSQVLVDCITSRDSPPVFLLDSNRHGDFSGRRPGDFDNRSVCFTTDFPSPNFLLAHGIKEILLVHRVPHEQRQDLTHVLFLYQEAGMELRQLRLNTHESIERLELKRPTWFGAMFQRVLISAGFRRAWQSGFGSWVPHPPSAG
jgi:hypothetical protein